ncbi:MAG: hypothetical protein AABW80_03680 [Nanoarchaeota archaeon]
MATLDIIIGGLIGVIGTIIGGLISSRKNYKFNKNLMLDKLLFKRKIRLMEEVSYLISKKYSAIKSIVKENINKINQKNFVEKLQTLKKNLDIDKHMLYSRDTELYARLIEFEEIIVRLLEKINNNFEEKINLDNNLGSLLKNLDRIYLEISNKIRKEIKI